MLTDSGRRTTVVIALNLVPFAGIAFLWFIGVIRDRVGGREDRLFTTVFLGSSLGCCSSPRRSRWPLRSGVGVTHHRCLPASTDSRRS
jgi:hypothetical protein